MPTYVDIDCLLPNGILIVLRCKRESTLENIKQELWHEAKRYPMFNILGDASAYIFVSITQDAEKEEFYDESRRLCDLKLFTKVLKVVEPKGNREEKILNYDIGMAIGMSVNEFDAIRDLEAITFRREMLDVCREVVTARESGGDEGLVLHAHPPDLESSSMLPHHVYDALLREASREKPPVPALAGSSGDPAADIDSAKIIVCIWVLPTASSGNPESEKQKYTIKTCHSSLPEELVAEAIRKRAQNMNRNEEQTKKLVAEYKGFYVLRVCGCNEYLLKSAPLSQYKYIRSCILNGTIPQLMLNAKASLVQSLPSWTFVLPSYARRGVSALEDARKQATMNLWDLEHNRLKVRVHCATYITVKESGQVYVRLGLYHGTEAICTFVDTQPAPSGKPLWNEWLEFDILLSDIPHAAKLCMGLCFIPKAKKKPKGGMPVHTCLAWGNVNLFDFDGRMHYDKKRIFLIQATSDDLLNPLCGQFATSQSQGVPCLDIEFERFAHPVSFPSQQQVQEYGRWLERNNPPPQPTPSDQEAEQIAEIARRDPLAELLDQEKTQLWKMRYYCARCLRASSLPKLLASVKWNVRQDVGYAYALLAAWPTCDVVPEVALELLDAAYADRAVRSFAVRCLDENLDDNKLSLYLLQLVQVVKFEPYLDNSLTRFLLMRALRNQRIGHFFYWHLRSEMHVAEVRLRYGLMLEAYCRGCGHYLRSLIKQSEALEKLTKLTDQLKSEKEEDDQKKLLTEHVNKTDYIEALQDLHSPLVGSSCLLGRLVVAKCRVLRSKKRPLWLEWANAQPLAEFYQRDFQLIFKNGDDLRQDMLTLQVIKIMDAIWQSEGMDFRMQPYPCLATGNSVGMIGVVRKAETVMQIQKKNKAAAMGVLSTQLHKWIKDRNPDDKYEVAIENFTRSCAGYAIATFVLGIGDRHPDNIMVTEQGRVFHIDFGHFLDHRKKKFGINRERVPFVLTDDFIYVLAKGAANPRNSPEFENFQRLCGQAYLCIRKHASLLITLFSMMLCSGLPELQSLNDVAYLRKTLAVDLSEERAIQFFQQQFYDAYDGSWTTKIDWLFHYLNSLKGGNS